MGRKVNIEIFEDTQRLYKTNQRLMEAVAKSSRGQQVIYSRLQYIGFADRTYAHPAKIVVSLKRTLEAAAPYAYAGKRSVS